MLVDLTPILTGGRGDLVEVHGVRVGDPGDRLDLARITSADERDAGEPRTWADGTVYRHGPDGSLIEIPLAERIDATLRRGGFLRTDAGAFAIEARRIARIFLRGEWLAELGVEREDQIALRFGPPELHHHSRGTRYYHYASRALVVAWRTREARLDHIQLGPDDFQDPRLGARALLDALIRAPTPSTGSRSARIREQRIAALVQAFGLGTPENVRTGGFLDDELGPARLAVLQEITDRGPLPASRERFVSAQILFNHLIAYRVDVLAVQRATAGWLECSDPLMLGMIAVQSAIAARLTEACADVDDWLCRLLVPDGRTLPFRELVLEHGYPDEDLDYLEQEEAWGLDD